jgi:hypothetical protein
MNGSEIIDELNLSKVYIDANLTNQNTVNFAYPGDGTNSSIITEASKYYLSASTIGATDNEKTPADFLNLKYYASDGSTTLATTKSRIDGAQANAKWVILGYHLFVNESSFSDNNCSSWGYCENLNDLNETLNHSLTKDVWIATLGEVTKYIKERNSYILHNYTNTTTQINFTVNNTLDNSIYNEEVTLKIDIDNRYIANQLVLDNSTRTPSYKIIDGNNFLLFDSDLNNTDVQIDLIPIVTLKTPANTTTDKDGTVNFECNITEAYDIVNISLYHNINGTFTLNQTINVTGNNNLLFDLR